MDPIRLAIERPVAVVAIVLMAVMFGVLALTSIPIQLTPDVRKPVIEIRTTEIDPQVLAGAQAVLYTSARAVEATPKSSMTGCAQ